MVNLSLNEPARTLVSIGLISIPVVLALAFIFGHTDAERTRRTLKPLRLSTSWILVVCAWIIWSATYTTLRAPALLIALGMTCGAIGDLILAGVIKAPNALIGGIVIFSIGHFCYIVSFSQTAQALGLSDPFSESLLWVIFVIAASFLWFFLIYNPVKSRVLNFGSLLYGWLIAIMAGVATALALQDARFTLTALGGVLFLISDILLGNRELRDHGWFLVHDVVWMLYIMGQALIVLTAAYA